MEGVEGISMVGKGASKTFPLIAVTLLFVSSLSVDEALAAKLLLPAISLMSTPSHYIGLSTITRELVRRGHGVTLLLLDRRGTHGMLDNSYTDNVTFPNSMSDMELKEVRAEMSTMMTSFKRLTLLEKFQKLPHLNRIRLHGCFELFANEATLSRLKSMNFDMILTSPILDTCDTLLAHYLDLPFTVITGTRRTPAFNEDLFGIPMPSSLVPFSLFTQIPHDMTFAQRVQNFVDRYVMHTILEYVFITRPIRQLQTTYGIRVDLTPRQVAASASLWLCQTTFALEPARPTSPNWIPIAGFVIPPAQPLAEELLSFIDGAGDHGFILFTLGSLTVSFSDQKITNAISKVFSELPQRVIWRYVGPRPCPVGNNTLILKWVPQNDLLAHPKVRMLIYHGGAAGVHESVYHGVPMIIIPLAADQPANAAIVEGRGIGVSLDSETLDEETFRRTVHRLIEEPSFKNNAVRASEIFRHDIVHPLDRAIFWIEHVIKFGSSHLRSRATHMGFIQLHSIDVLSFAIAVFLSVLFVIWKFLHMYFEMLLQRLVLVVRRNFKIE